MPNKYWIVLFLVVLLLDGAQTHFFVTRWNIEKELMPGPKLILKHLGTTGMWVIRIVLGGCFNLGIYAQSDKLYF